MFEPRPLEQRRSLLVLGRAGAGRIRLLRAVLADQLQPAAYLPSHPRFAPLFGTSSVRLFGTVA
ncbi:MAG: hypothetical protein IT167_12370 [Bryobacterales bacterium]|nr:hypothetical protein [Bryobacterales bacterium]